MSGISSSGKNQIALMVEDLFDRIAIEFIGDIPKLRGKKLLVISSRRNQGLGELFVQAMSNRTPNDVERDVMKGFLESAHGYIDSLKSRTRSNITEQVDALVREAKNQGRRPDESEISEILNSELEKAKSQLRAIAEAESTKMRNMGHMMDITRVAERIGDEDPNVYFAVIKDGSTCKECIRLHLVNGGIPRMWKLSELKQGYHKRSEDVPSIFGLHPHCRCTLVYLAKGYGFENGRMNYIGEGHDELKKQRGTKSK